MSLIDIISITLSFLVFVVFTGVIGKREGIQIILSLLACIPSLPLLVVTLIYTIITGKMANTMARQTEGDLLLRLNDLYAQSETREGIYFVNEMRNKAKSKLKEDFSKNRYYFGEYFYRKYGPNSNEDQLRWHLVNFWYTVAVLVEKNLIEPKTILERFGQPQDIEHIIVDILEPIEAVRAYKIELRDKIDTNPESIKREWPPLKLCARLTGKQSQFPVCLSEFKKYAENEWAKYL
jgi:hypothetical protein